MPDVGTYNPELGPTKSKILNNIIPKGKIMRYHDHELKRRKNVPGQAHYFKKASDDLGMTQIKMLSKSPTSIRVRRH